MIHKKLYEVQGFSSEPVEIYKKRYSRPVSELSVHELNDPHRYIDSIFNHFDENCSILVFGAGHSINCNTYLKSCEKIQKVVSIDFIEEASIGLDEKILFYNTNILKQDLPVVCDYVFSSHVLEHFTREELLNTVFPRLIKAAKKEVISVVPYGSNWSDEPSHKIRFYENDEFASLSYKYFKLLNGQEIVFWTKVG